MAVDVMIMMSRTEAFADPSETCTPFELLAASMAEVRSRS